MSFQDFSTMEILVSSEADFKLHFSVSDDLNLTVLAPLNLAS